jgi:hypothetical protein
MAAEVYGRQAAERDWGGGKQDKIQLPKDAHVPTLPSKLLIPARPHFLKFLKPLKVYF